MTHVDPSERYRDLENHYPHIFLTTKHQTLAMGVVWTFVCLATRFGFEALPVGYPGAVLAAIKLPESTEWLYINLSREEVVVQTKAELSMSLEPGFPRKFIEPATTHAIIIRAINDVFISATMAKWQALYLVVVFFASQGIRDNTTDSLWYTVLRTANHRAPLDLIPIIHDRLLGPSGTSHDPREAGLALRSANRECGDAEIPRYTAKVHEGLGKQLAVGMMIGPAQFIVGITGWGSSFLVLDCHNQEEPCRKSARSKHAFLPRPWDTL